ncbi:MAG: hypothetical protein QXY45_03660 [Candidatus Aenigmatarchaeota archaeon]
MVLTMQDTKPLGLCIATQELFDTKRYILNFCDGIVLRGRDPSLINKVTAVKRDLNSFRTQSKFLEGHKAIIVSNIDKIMGSVDRYYKANPNEVESVLLAGKEIIEKVLRAATFDDIMKLENEFKTKITLPVYQMFINDLKRSNIKMV